MLYHRVILNRISIPVAFEKYIGLRIRKTNLSFFSSNASGIPVEFINQDGSQRIVYATEGESLLDLAHENDIDLEGACEGSLACSTCHVILDSETYKKLPEPVDEENDMLDLAFGLTETSRLGCQVKVTPDLKCMKARLPSATRNMAVDGFKPKPH
jgi:ferredoxin